MIECLCDWVLFANIEEDLLALAFVRLRNATVWNLLNLRGFLFCSSDFSLVQYAIELFVVIIVCYCLLLYRAKLACVRHFLSYSHALFNYFSDNLPAFKTLSFSSALIQLLILLLINLQRGALYRYTNTFGSIIIIIYSFSVAR